MSNAGVYVNPFANAGKVTPGRLDQGQDFNLTPGAPIGAIGKAKIIEVQPNWYAGQPAIFYQLLEGPRKGEILYVGEQINPTVTAGEIVDAGQTIATYASSGTGIEYGIGGGGGRTLQQATVGPYSGSGATPAGEAFAKQLKELGGPGASSSSGGGLCSGLGPASFVCKPAELAKEGVDAATGAIGEGASDIGKEAIEGGISLVKPIATKLTLYGVLIFAAVGMMIFGLSELLKPVGGPDVRGALAGLAKGGEDAGEVAA